MQRIARFELVSKQQFLEDFERLLGGGEARALAAYEQLRLPRRATAGSAGYDFFSPIDFSLAPGEQIHLPTGIRACMQEGWVLQCFPRSGLGFKFRMQLNNTVGIIDSDYYGSQNEGHIQCKLTNDSREGKTLHIATGQGMMQGIFLPFGITEDDAACAHRDGGFGSTTK